MEAMTRASIFENWTPLRLCRPMVSNLWGGTEPYKFHTCIHRAFCNWKSKICFFFSNSQNIDITIYCIIAQTGQPVHHESYKWGEPNRRTPQTDSPSPWGSIKPRSRASGEDSWFSPCMQTSTCVVMSNQKIQSCNFEECWNIDYYYYYYGWYLISL